MSGYLSQIVHRLRTLSRGKKLAGCLGAVLLVCCGCLGLFFAIPTPEEEPAAAAVTGDVAAEEPAEEVTAAQACFGYCWEQVANDVHGLDGDSDGVACESLL